MHLLTIGLLGAAVCILADIVLAEIRRAREIRDARRGSERVLRIMDTYRTAPRGALTQDEVNEIVAQYSREEVRRVN